MELMTDEMEDFKVVILKLELLSKQLSNLSIPISTKALDENLNSFLENQDDENRLKDDFLKEIEKKLKYGRIIPNYLLILLCSWDHFIKSVGLFWTFLICNTNK